MGRSPEGLAAAGCGDSNSSHCSGTCLGADTHTRKTRTPLASRSSARHQSLSQAPGCLHAHQLVGVENSNDALLDPGQPAIEGVGLLPPPASRSRTLCAVASP
jgi:hypothetical protein